MKPQTFLALWVGAQTRVRTVLHDEVGEGVISTAIAVLVMAVLGAAMFLAFQAIMDGAASNVGSQVDSIGG